MERKKISSVFHDDTFLASLVRSSHDAIEALLLDGTIVVWNHGSEKLYGYFAKEMLGKSPVAIYPENRTDELSVILNTVKQGEYIEPYVTQRKLKNGTLLDVVISASPIKDEEGTISGVSIIARPFAGQERVDQYTRSLIEASLDPFVTISPEGKITDVNEATVLVTGVAREKLINSDFLIYFTEPEKAREGYELVFSKGTVTDYPLTIKHASGRVTDVLYNGSIYKDRSGNVLGVFAAARDITARKKAELKFQTILEAAPDAIVMINQEGTIILTNSQVETLFGYSRGDILGKAVEVLIPQRYHGKHPQHRKNYFDEPHTRPMGVNLDLYGLHKNGNEFPVEISLSPLEIEDGTVAIAAIRDISRQKQASQYARSLIEASLDPFFTISPEGKITDVNEATVKLTGVARENLIGSDFSSYFTEPDEALDGYKQVFKEGFVRDYPLAISHVSGAITHVVYNATVFRDIGGSVVGVFAAARDITQRKKAEEQLHATSAYARSLIESNLDPLVTISLEGKITDVNHASELITGVTREWLIGSDFSIYFTEPRKARAGYRLVLKEGSVRDYPLVIRHSSGSTKDVLYNASVYRDAQGKVQGVFAAARDITEIKKSSQYARSLIEASLDPLVTISPEGKITDVNEATINITGVPREKLIGTDFSSYFTEPSKARVGYEEAFKQGYITDYPLTIQHHGGKLIEVLYNATVYKDEDGNILGVFAAARDYSRVKKTTQQLEAINQELDAFTYSVAHDLKSPLRAINGFSKILLDDYSAKLDKEGKRIVDIISSNTKRMGQLIEDLLAFSHIGRHEVKKENLHMYDMVKEIRALLMGSLVERKIEFEIKPLPDTKGDRALIRQVWVNLIANAIKFTQTRQYARIEIGSLDDVKSTVTYYIKDNGLGFDMKYVDKLFGVFQRLHSHDIEGTGIGLANVKRIIMRHGGSVRGEGELGSGAIFYFTLPRE